jgi:hypothetical protein
LGILHNKEPRAIRPAKERDTVVMRQRFSRSGAALASAALILGSMIAALGAGSAGAAPARAKQAVEAKAPAAKRAAVGTKAAKPAEEPKAAYTKAGPEEDAGCLSARRKLFVEGEGWIVRRVTTCR